MRITENRMTELAANRTGAARERVAKSGEEMSSGIRVDRPSDDPAAWAAAQRARLAKATSESRGGAIATSSERLDAVDGALATIGEVVARSRELAVQAANGTISAAERGAIAQEVRALAGSALAAANAQGNGGQFLFSGSRGDTAPFDATGAYFGDTLDNQIESSPKNRQVVTINGSILTASSGIDVLAELEAFAVALESNNVAGVQAAVATLDVGTEQLSRARSSVGALSASLGIAGQARQQLELRLSEEIARGVEVDSIAAASDLAGASQALEVSQAVTQMIIDITRAV